MVIVQLSEANRNVIPAKAGIQTGSIWIARSNRAMTNSYVWSEHFQKLNYYKE